MKNKIVQAIQRNSNNNNVYSIDSLFNYEIERRVEEMEIKCTVEELKELLANKIDDEKACEQNSSSIKKLIFLEN